MWYDPKIMATTLDLYFKGVSLRKISDHLRQCHGLEVRSFHSLSLDLQVHGCDRGIHRDTGT